MKPNFALSLSFEGIRLLHRAGDAWSVVGEVALESAEIGAELAMLRKTALALDPAGLRSKIILPNDQIRYLSFDSTRTGEDEIRARLSQETPYRIEDLVWDVARGGGRTHVAAVARETLDEAESFAVTHRFGPVGFVAVPEEFTFAGEPFFGPTKVAATLLPPGETVERDRVPVRLLSGASVTRPAAAAPAVVPAAEPLPPEPVPPEPLPEPAAETEPEPVPERVLEAPPADAPGALPPAPEALPEPEPVAEEAPERDPDPSPGPAEEAPLFASRARTLPAADGPPPAPAPARPRPDPDGLPAGPASVEPVFARHAPPPPAPAPDAGRRTPPPGSGPSLRAAGRSPAPPIVPVGGRTLGPAPGRPDRPGPLAPPPEGGPGTMAGRLGVIARNARSAIAAGAEQAAAPRGRPRHLLAVLMGLLVLFLVIVALWLGRTDNALSRLFGGERNVQTDIATAEPVALPVTLPPLGQAQAVTPPAADPPAPEEGEELAPAARDPVVASGGADPAAVAAAAAMVAAEMAAADGAAATGPAPLPAGEVTLITPEEAERVYAATGVWLRAPRLPVTPQSDDLSAVAVSGSDAPPAARGGTALPALGPDAGLVAPAAPPPPGTRLPRDGRGFILATPEGTVTPDGLVIFAGSPAIVPPSRPGSEAPPAGPVAATPTAAEAPAPDGQPLATPPATRPAIRPAAAAASGAPAAVSPQTAEVALPGQPMAAPPATRPRLRPGSAAAEPPAAVETEGGAAAGGVTLAGLSPQTRPEGILPAAAETPLPAFDGTRPRPRPDDLAPVEALAETAAVPGPEEPATQAVDPAAAVADALAGIVEGAADPLASATPRAVAVVRRPEPRPANFARAVQQQTERLARASAAAQQESSRASLGTPEEEAETAEEEVEVAAAAPSGAVPRSVAEAATVANVMSMRDINLIGVYGTPSNRRALVRLGNGSYVRVSVGDSLDGGRVAAIDDTSLNYVRRGRSVTLEIPGP